MRRVALVVALLSSLVAALAAEEAAAQDLWYRTTIFGTYDESMEGMSPSGLIFSTESVRWRMRSNTATIVSRNGRFITVGASIRGKIDAWDQRVMADSTTFNTGVRCTHRGRDSYSAFDGAPVTGQLSGSILGLITRPALEVRGGGHVPVEHTFTITCPDTPGGPGTTDTLMTPIVGLASVLVPPSDLFAGGLAPAERIRFGRFFTVQGTFDITRSLDELYVGAIGTWQRHWEIEVWFLPCPRLRC